MVEVTLRLEKASFLPADTRLKNPQTARGTSLPRRAHLPRTFALLLELLSIF